MVAGGGSRAAEIHQLPSGLGERWRVPAPPSPTLSELFAAPRDAGWAGFLLAQIGTASRCCGCRSGWRSSKAGESIRRAWAVSRSFTSKRGTLGRRCGQWRRA